MRKQVTRSPAEDRQEVMVLSRDLSMRVKAASLGITAEEYLAEQAVSTGPSAGTPNCSACTGARPSSGRSGACRDLALRPLFRSRFVSCSMPWAVAPHPGKQTPNSCRHTSNSADARPD